MITLTPSQQTVFNQIKTFVQSDANVFILRGYAGTGKTTMIQTVVDEISKNTSVVLMAPTGRAARVLASKTKYKASTIHRAIYGRVAIHAKKCDDIADLEFKYVFPIANSDSKIVAIIDEASMLCSRTIQQELFQFGTDNLMDDLLTYVRPSFGGKLIFVGDPAQLPPVGDSESNALRREFFEEKGLKVMEADLTEVLRQSGESVILKNAMQIRNLLDNDKRNKLVFEEKPNEVEILEKGKLLEHYLNDRKESNRNNSVVICFTNQSAYNYNKEIRESLYNSENPPLRVGDVLMVVQNNYTLDRMNGEFVPVLEIGESTRQSAPVYVQKGGHRERQIITLDFIQIKITDGNGVPTSCLLLLDLLNNGNASLTIDQQRALYINFRMRYKDLKPGTEEFCNALQSDAYYNCLRAKYGYAVTGHKCQGGEWGKVYVDYYGRTGLSNDCLRWAYTATTRAQQTLYVANLPHITPFSKFRIEEVQSCKNINEEFRVLGDVELSPFHSSTDPKYLHAKWMCIERNLQWTGYKIVEIESKPYLEIYRISTPDGIIRFDLHYKKGGVFLPAKCGVSNFHTVLLTEFLNDERQMPLKMDYQPSDEIHEQLYNLICNACDTLSIPLTNAVEHNEDYNVCYYFRTSGNVSYLKVYINKDNFITYAKPMSLNGWDDAELKLLINEIKNHFV